MQRQIWECISRNGHCTLEFHFLHSTLIFAFVVLISLSFLCFSFGLFFIFSIIPSKGYLYTFYGSFIFDLFVYKNSVESLFNLFSCLPICLGTFNFSWPFFFFLCRIFLSTYFSFQFQFYTRLHRPVLFIKCTSVQFTYFTRKLSSINVLFLHICTFYLLLLFCMPFFIMFSFFIFFEEEICSCKSVYFYFFYIEFNIFLSKSCT